MTHYIYKIYYIEEPNKIYIGRTGNLKTRLRAHKNPSKNSYKDNWIKDRKSRGWILQMDVLDSADKDNICELEVCWIQKMKDDNFIMTNGSKGGDGSVELSDYTRRLLSKSKKGIKPSDKCLEASKKYWTGRPKSKEHKLKLSQSRKGKLNSQEYKDKMSIKLKERGTPIWACEANKRKAEIITPDGRVIIVDGIKDFALENGLDPSHLSKVAQGKAKSHKRYKVRYLD